MEVDALTEATLTEFQRALPPKHMIILKFTAEWCGPCKIIKSLCDDFIKQKPNSIYYFEIDIDDSIELYMKFKKVKMLNGIPGLLAFHSGTKDPNRWYIPDDSVLGSNKQAVTDFFVRCLNYAN